MTERKKATGDKSRASRRGKILTTSEKAEAIALWKAGDVTLEELESRFHRDRSTFVRLFNKEGVTKGEAREAHEKKVTEAVETAAVGDAALQATRIREAKERGYKMVTAIQGALFNLAIRAKQENVSIAVFHPEIKAYKDMLTGLKIGREDLWAILGLDQETKPGEGDDLPELVIKELSATEIKQMHKTMEETNALELASAADFDAMEEGV